jgi:hypothetical protein
METNEPSTIALLRSKGMSVETVEPVGTDESSTSSSSNTDDLIPEKVRKIFESKGPQDFFKVFYINAAEEIMTVGQWLFEGRDREYEDQVTLDADGPCTGAIVLFQGRTRKYSISGQRVIKGDRVRIACKGVQIP